MKRLRNFLLNTDHGIRILHKLQEVPCSTVSVARKSQKTVQRSLHARTLGTGNVGQGSAVVGSLLDPVVAEPVATGDLRAQHAWRRNHTPQPHASSHMNPGIRNHSTGGGSVFCVVPGDVRTSPETSSSTELSSSSLVLAKAAVGKLGAFSMSVMPRITEPSLQLSRCLWGKNVCVSCSSGKNVTDRPSTKGLP